MTLKNLSNQNYPKNEKILILGNGYIGSHLKRHLTNSGYETRVLDSKDVNYHDQKTLWKFLVVEFGANVIINCSGFTGRPNIDEAETKKDLCWELNVSSPLRCAELITKLGKKYIHIGSGCIYDGYDKQYIEEDAPNFGLFSEVSSFYSKCKHAFESITSHLPIKTVRIRMPISSLDDERSYLSKIKKYNNLINYKNSKTYIPDLCEFISKLISSKNISWDDNEIFNVVNPQPLDTKEVTEIMNMFNKGNPNWSFVELKDLNIATGRSNCVLSNKKVSKLYEMRTEEDILKEVLND